MPSKNFWAVFISLCAIWILSPGAGRSAEETPQTPSGEKLTFQDFHLKVMKVYPQLKLEDANTRRAVALKEESESGFLPKVTGHISYSAGNDPVYVFGTLLRQAQFTEQDFEVHSLNSPRWRSDFTIGASAEMILFDAYQTISKVRIAGHLLKTQELKRDAAQNEANFLAVESFLNAVLFCELSLLSREVNDAAAKDVLEAENLKDKGAVLGADFYAAKVHQASLLRFGNHCDAGLKRSRMFLNILMGEGLEKDFQLEGVLPRPAAENLPLSEWVRLAGEHCPELKAANETAEASKLELSREKYTRFPRFGVFGEFEESSEDLSQGSGDYLVGFKGTMDLFDPSFNARIKAAESAAAGAAEEVFKARDGVLSGLAEAFFQYVEAAKNQTIFEQGFKDAGEAMNLTERLYQEGRKSIADLIEMRRAYLETGQALYIFQASLQSRYAKLLYLSGLLRGEKFDRLKTAFSK